MKKIYEKYRHRLTFLPLGLQIDQSIIIIFLFYYTLEYSNRNLLC